jgi:hypothetical protein
MSPIPAQDARLRPGAHLGPEDGVCLMEYVSMLAGEPFGDTPRCTDALLAAVARLVNDATSDDGRARLIGFAPRLVGCRSADPRTAPAIVASAVTSVLDVAPARRALERHLRRAWRRAAAARDAAPGSPAERIRDLLYRYGPALHGVDAAVRAASRGGPVETRDALLRAVLGSAVTAVETAPGAPAEPATRARQPCA